MKKRLKNIPHILVQYWTFIPRVATDIYHKMDELCQLTTLSALTRTPKCYSEQLLYYYRAYAICDRSITSGSITPAHVFWDRGIKSLRSFMDCEQS